MGELGIGSRRLGWGCPLPVPVPVASRALRFGELLNRFADLSFFLFCYTEGQKHKETEIGRTSPMKKKKLVYIHTSIYFSFSEDLCGWRLSEGQARTTQLAKEQSLSAIICELR